MNPMYDYKRYAILYVDDEEKSLKYFTRAFGDVFRIFTATNAADGYKILEDHQEEIAIVMSDQRMAGEKGVQFLERSRRLRPQIIRILATAFSDLEAAIDAVNTGAIYKYITKPWDPAALEMTLKRGLEFFIVQTERDFLLREKLSAVHRMLITDRVLGLGVLAAGLGQQLHNTFDAVQTFLELTPETRSQSGLDLGQIQNPGFWQDFHRKVQHQVKAVQELLADLADESGAPFKFDTEVSLHEVAAQAIAGVGEELQRRNIQVSNLIPPTLPLLTASSSPSCCRRNCGTCPTARSPASRPRSAPPTAPSPPRWRCSSTTTARASRPTRSCPWWTPSRAATPRPSSTARS
jgi:two-component system, probable response regulator PhcQ